MWIAAVALFLQVHPPASDLPLPSQACFEVFADAEGEMAMAEDAAWRVRNLAEIQSWRGERRHRKHQIEIELKRNAASREALQHEFDEGGIGEEDFTSARSELDQQARLLIEERDHPSVPACEP